VSIPNCLANYWHDFILYHCVLDAQILVGVVEERLYFCIFTALVIGVGVGGLVMFPAVFSAVFSAGIGDLRMRVCIYLRGSPLGLRMEIFEFMYSPYGS
jgi:hypothetical protein